METEFNPAKVTKKIPLDEHGHRNEWRPTATRLCLKSNPSPLARQASFAFKGFIPEYAQTQVRNPSPDWVTGAPDLYPFRPVEVHMLDVQGALCCSRLSPWHRYDSDNWPLLPYENVYHAVVKVIGDSRLGNPDWKFFFTSEEFKATRAFLQRGLRSSGTGNRRGPWL